MGQHPPTSVPRFQSTLPARGATAVWTEMCGAINISIHAPREGSDTASTANPIAITVFQSTLPARGATLVVTSEAGATSDFNPRSPRGERRQRPRPLPRWAGYFNPRSPRGERLITFTATGDIVAFQSTLPARGATVQAAEAIWNLDISIHAPREGSDPVLR